MSDDRKGGFGGGDKGGFGPKKPKATFGDVMLGIPAGRGGEREERGGRDRDRGRGGPRGGGGGDRPRGDRPRRDDRPQQASPEAKPAEGAEGAAAQPPAEGAESKPQGEQPRHEKREGRGGGRDRGHRGGGGGRPPEKRREEKKPQGPLVVVKRATGQIETRPLEQPPAAEAVPSDDASTDSQPLEPATAGVTPVSPPAPTEVRPVQVRPSVADELPESQSFAEMFEHAQKTEGPGARKHYRIGEKVSGKIFQLGADTAFISLGGKSEAMIDLIELKDDEGILRFGVGDVVEAHVVESGAKGIILSRKISKGSASLAMLAEAKLSGMPVEGLVLSVNKGGLEVAVGDVRAFCPASQVDVRFVGKLDQFVGEKHLFRVTEVREKNVVPSRRALVEEEQKKLAEETRKSLEQGKVVRGKVTGVRDFGAFVDLGGIEGMIPVSEMSHTRIGHPSEVLKVSDEVEVEILRIEPAQPSSPDKAKHKERITLSMRSRQQDPWKAALEEIKEGQRLKGKVARLTAFGAFVELRPGVDGLIHVSALSNRRVAHPRDVVKVGQEVEVQVEKVDPAEKRVGLRLVTEEGVVGEGVSSSQAPSAESAPSKPSEPAAPRPRVGQVVTGKIDRIEQYGVFLAFPGGKGLVPASETGTERGTDMKRAFQLGQELRAEVLEIDSSGKIRLSITGAQKAEERADMEAWKATQKKGGGAKGFGTLGDLLKAKLGK